LKRRDQSATQTIHLTGDFDARWCFARHGGTYDAHRLDYLQQTREFANKTGNAMVADWLRSTGNAIALCGKAPREVGALSA